MERVPKVLADAKLARAKKFWRIGPLGYELELVKLLHYGRRLIYNSERQIQFTYNSEGFCSILFPIHEKINSQL